MTHQEVKRLQGKTCMLLIAVCEDPLPLRQSLQALSHLLMHKIKGGLTDLD